MSYLKSQPDLDLKALLRGEPALGAPIAEYHQALLRGPSPISIAERELIAAYVSGLNACDFCSGEHALVAEAFGIPEGLYDALIADLETAPVDDRLRAMLRYTKKLNETPARIHQGDIDALYAAGLDDQAVYHLASIVALFNFNNRLINGIGIPPASPEALEKTVPRLKEKGYQSTLDYVRGKWE